MDIFKSYFPKYLVFKRSSYAKFFLDFLILKLFDGYIIKYNPDELII